MYYHLHKLGLTDDDRLIVRRGVMNNTTFRLTMRADLEEYQPALVIADPIIRILGLADVNDYALTDKAVTPLVELARQYNTHFMAVHHCNKMTNTLDLDSILGSTAFAGSVDAAILMGKSGDTRYIRTHPRYLRDKAIKRTPIYMDESTGGVDLGEPTTTEKSTDTLGTLAVRMLNWYTAQNEKLNTTRVCKGSDIPKEEGLKALKWAEEKGWIVDVTDENDGRKSYVHVTNYPPEG